MMPDVSADEACVENSNWQHLTRLASLSGSAPFSLLCHHRVVQPLAQRGPTCGLVAAAMAAAALGLPAVGVDQLLTAAVTSGLSAQGEMFSARGLARLISGVFAAVCAGTGNTFLCTVETFSSESVVKRTLLSGGVILVPYDADKNHWPCSRRGHGAHWTLVCGAMLSSRGQLPDGPDDVTDGRQDSLCDSLLADQLLLVCRHGKSCHEYVWSYRSLCVSNSQLYEARPSRHGELPYVLIDGSVEAGLRDLCICLSARHVC